MVYKDSKRRKVVFCACEKSSAIYDPNIKKYRTLLFDALTYHPQTTINALTQPLSPSVPCSCKTRTAELPRSFLLLCQHTTFCAMKSKRFSGTPHCRKTRDHIPHTSSAAVCLLLDTGCTRTDRTNRTPPDAHHTSVQ